MYKSRVNEEKRIKDGLKEILKHIAIMVNYSLTPIKVSLNLQSETLISPSLC